MKIKRAIAFELNRLTEEQRIILGHLTYHAGKLWNQANYLIQNGSAKPYYKDLYHKLKDNSIQCRCKWSKEHLRKFKKECVDLLTGLKKVVRIKLYNLKGSSESLHYSRIGVAGRVNLPRGIRAVMSCQTPRGAPSYRAS